MFISVSKGQVAPSQDLTKSFGAKVPLDNIILEILNKGEIQVGEKERHAQLDRLHREVLDIIAGKLVDPSSKRVYTTGMLEKALDQLSTKGAQAHDSNKDHSKKGEASTDTSPQEQPSRGKEKELPIWTGVNTHRSAKLQALDAMKALIAHQPIAIARARMRLRVVCPTSVLKQPVKVAQKKENGAEENTEPGSKSTGTIKDCILGHVEEVQSQDVVGNEWELVGYFEPGAFKSLSEFVSTQTKGRANVEILDMAVVRED